MLKADVILFPSGINGKELQGKVAVVIDVLRASTTAITALTNGCQAIIPAMDVTEAGELARRLGDNCVLGGERNGLKIEGFHLGNSPREYTAEVVNGKTIVLTTTNGTKAIRMATGASQILIASFANIAAIVKHLAAQNMDVSLICAGRHGGFSFEDTACAGAIIEALKPDYLTDSARMAHIIYKRGASKPEMLVAASEHAEYLESIGFGADIEFCARMNWTETIPVFQDSRLVVLR